MSTCPKHQETIQLMSPSWRMGLKHYASLRTVIPGPFDIYEHLRKTQAQLINMSSCVNYWGTTGVQNWSS